VFGSLFQSVMEPRDRRQIGAHYTSERDILKLVRSLFLDDLRAEFEHLKARRDPKRNFELRKFHEKLGALKFFDPADIKNNRSVLDSIGDWFTGFHYPPEPAPVALPQPPAFTPTAQLVHY